MLRLDKMLAHIGYGSRKEVKELIRKGNVLVNGSIIKNDDYKVSLSDEIIVDDTKVTYLNEVFIMLNKPQGYISATDDNYQDTVLDLVNEYRNYKIFPVGRLDKDSEGLLILTNNGKVAYNLLSPKSHVNKTYYVKFKGEFKEEYFEKFSKGMVLEDGYKTLPAKIELLSSSEANVTICEGKFHQVKRMFLVNNMEVTYLKRIKFGNIELDKSLQIGKYRLLTDEEINLLKENGNEQGI